VPGIEVRAAAAQPPWRGEGIIGQLIVARLESRSVFSRQQLPGPVKIHIRITLLQFDALILIQGIKLILILITHLW
jgi:hypothetical protein